MNMLPTNLKVEAYGEEKACWRKDVEALGNSCEDLVNLEEEQSWPALFSSDI